MVISQILSGMMNTLNNKSQWIKVKIRRMRSRVFPKRLMWKIRVLIALREKTASWSPLNWVVRGYEWIVNEVSIPEDVSVKLWYQKEKRESFQKQMIYFVRVDAKIQRLNLMLILYGKKDDVRIGLDLKL